MLSFGVYNSHDVLDIDEEADASETAQKALASEQQETVGNWSEYETSVFLSVLSCICVCVFCRATTIAGVL